MRMGFFDEDARTFLDQLNQQRAFHYSERTEVDITGQVGSVLVFHALPPGCYSEGTSMIAVTVGQT